VYTHRNGETEKPLMEGRFWFKGCVHSRWLNEHDQNQATLLFVYERHGLRVYLDEINFKVPLKDCEGRWWGPVLPPPDF
jgi:hypothetical protein